MVNRSIVFSSNKCIKCKTTTDSAIQAFWECSKIKTLWADLQRWLTEKLKVSIYLSPSLCLINDTQCNNTKKYPVGWIILLTSLVIKKLILHYWKDTRSPSIYHWKINMLHILEKEQYPATERKQTQQFKQIWSDIINVLQR